MVSVFSSNMLFKVQWQHNPAHNIILTYYHTILSNTSRIHVISTNILSVLIPAWSKVLTRSQSMHHITLHLHSIQPSLWSTLLFSLCIQNHPCVFRFLLYKSVLVFFHSLSYFRLFILLLNLELKVWES